MDHRRETNNPSNKTTSNASATASKPTAKPRNATQSTKVGGKTPKSAPVQQPLPSAINKSAHVDKFQLAHSKHIEAARKHATNYASSSDDDDDNLTANNGADTDAAARSMVCAIFQNYTAASASGDGSNLLAVQKTQQLLENTLHSGAATCLICIGTVRRADHIWSCTGCYNFFHLGCIQRWASDSTAQKRAQHAAAPAGHYTNSGEYVPRPALSADWDCPKCRRVYDANAIPDEYLCFCAKETNPPLQPWLLPHSCGEPCQKQLQPACGHRCLLLCHPGACPPCPQILHASCLCGRSAPRTIRCAQRTWKCTQHKCTELLACGRHRCAQPACHAPGACAPCEQRTRQPCRCGATDAVRLCAAEPWPCQTPCDRLLACGKHRCELLCCPPDAACRTGAGPCPRGLRRTCPCGKTQSAPGAACTDEAPVPCGSTCERRLDCVQHFCEQRCHRDRCGPCPIVTEKLCRCGTHTKQLPCSRQFTCETKCRRLRRCEQHACSRKCCDGECPPCDKICGKALPCGRHKCTAPCHRGQCYPCAERTTVRCACGQTVRQQPCGRKANSSSAAAKLPRCTLPCGKLSAARRCHHDAGHRCHAGECPPCQALCGERNATTGCEHPCAARCHDAVRVTADGNNSKRPPAGPWEAAQQRREPPVSWRKLAHPECAVLVPVTCAGGHETVPQPCCESTAVRSCGRPCGRQLRCGHHRCEADCHAVEDVAGGKEDAACTPCTAGCAQARPDGCAHSCERACHVGPCAKCRVNIKFDCHCGSTPVYQRCGDFYANAITAAQRDQMRSCENRCTRNFACGHRCLATCHSGDCPNAEACTKKVKITCPCKTRKADTRCDRVRAGETLPCDERCAEKVEQARQQAEEAARHEREAQEERNRLELVEFEKKLGRRKPRERKRDNVEVAPDHSKWIWIGCAAGAAMVVVAIVLGVLFK